MIETLIKLIVRMDNYIWERRKRHFSYLDEEYDTCGITVLGEEQKPNFWDGIE